MLCYCIGTHCWPSVIRKFCPVERVARAAMTNGRGTPALKIYSIFISIRTVGAPKGSTNKFKITMKIYQRHVCYALVYLHQVMMEMTIICLERICPNTMMSFWNMSMASAPIQATDAMVK